MMARQSQDAGGVIAGINVTPLVDIMLVLLIVFMVTAKLVVQPARALPVDLPQSYTGESVDVVLAIQLLADGTLHVNGSPVRDDADFVDKARVEHGTYPDVKAVIQADGHALHERVIHLMDLLSQADITHIAFAVKK